MLEEMIHVPDLPMEECRRRLRCITETGTKAFGEEGTSGIVCQSHRRYRQALVSING
jgi:hypothetical protein